MRMNIDIEDVIDRIIKETKKSKKEVMKRIETKKDDLGGLITDEGAACIVAKEMGVEVFEAVTSTSKRKRIQLKDLTVGMNPSSVIGRVSSIFPVHEYTQKNGQKGKNVKFNLEDSTAQVRVVLWNEQIKYVAEKKVEENAIIEIKRATIRPGMNNEVEIHLGKQGLIEVNPKDVDSTELENKGSPISFMKINQLQLSMWNVNLIGKVQWKSQISTFNRQNGSGKVASLSIFDETGQTRVALWDAHAAFIDQIAINEWVKIENGYTRGAQDNAIELHVGNKSKISKENSVSLALPDANKGSITLNEVKIQDLASQSKNLKVVGTILEKGEPREIIFKADSSTHQVCDLQFADETGTISLSVWDEDIPKIHKGKTYCVENGYISVFRSNLQLNVGKFGVIKPVDIVITNINKENNLSDQKKEVSRKSIMDLEENEVVEIAGAIVSLPEKGSPIYNSCPKCLKKVEQKDNTWVCKKCGIVTDPVPRMFFSLTLDDGTDNIRITVADKVAESLLGMTTKEAKEMIEEKLSEQFPFIHKAKDLSGKEIIVRGSTLYDSYTSKLKLMTKDITYPDSRTEILRLLPRVQSVN